MSLTKKGSESLALETAVSLRWTSECRSLRSLRSLRLNVFVVVVVVVAVSVVSVVSVSKQFLAAAVEVFCVKLRAVLCDPC